MVVLSLTSCPPALKGDLTKWLCEVNTGVYVGTPSARVREALWGRICEHVKDGKATLVYSSNTEQGYTFLAHNTQWEPVDFDGLVLMRRPDPLQMQAHIGSSLAPGFSKAAQYRMAQYAARKQKKKLDSYVVLDLETTGLDPKKDSILEVGLIRVEHGTAVLRYSALIHSQGAIPPQITNLTGITAQQTEEGGKDLPAVLREVASIMQGLPVLGYRVEFDCSFLQTAFETCKMTCPIKKTVDILDMVRKKVEGVRDYKLSTVAKYLGIPVESQHRALADCETAYGILCKLNES